MSEDCLSLTEPILHPVRRGSLHDAGELLRNVAGPCSGIYVVHDVNVLWVVREIEAVLEPSAVLSLDISEKTKTLGTAEGVCRWLLENGADRNSFVVAVGGGVTTDLVGFAASVFMRGVRFAFLPTTLLAQVDASIGGKTGVDLDSLKNMIGVFRPCELTFICPEVLETLEYSEITGGASELFKSFIIDNGSGGYSKALDFFRRLREAASSGSVKSFLKDNSDSLQGIISSAAGVKAAIVGRDPYESGERRVLNLGHTFAHAIEKVSSSEISHGEAVAMGMILAARLSERLGLADAGFASVLEDDFRSCGLKTVCPFPVADLVDAMSSDKKSSGDQISFILPERVGSVVIRPLTAGRAAALLTD